jgi:putative membrane protein
MKRAEFFTFWREAVSIKGSVTPIVILNVFVFGLIAAFICVADHYIEEAFKVNLGLEVGPHEIAGAALGLLLILRTNAGYDRWWEGRILWGGIVNQCRNLALESMAYGPRDKGWHRELLTWVKVFPHAAKATLRSEKESINFEHLLGKDEAEKLVSSSHMAFYVLLKIAVLLREALEKGEINHFAFAQMERERSQLMDHIGACERILKTPLPFVYSVKIRRFVAIFLVTLPFALLHQMETDWLVPLVIMLVGYPLVSLDQIGIELQNPFYKSSLNHLPLDEIASSIEKTIHEMNDSFEKSEVK